MYRTHTCGQLRAADAGAEVELAGWVHRRRDHGGVIFIDLRDKYGLTQIKFDSTIDEKALAEADHLRGEWVIRVKGRVVARPADMINTKMLTGEVEVEIGELEILSRSKTPPFEIDEEKADEAKEHIRLKYRFLDLRRQKIQDLLTLKHEYFRYLREYFHGLGFVEVQTPILAASSPEGARDFLVPSRIYPGHFYALPQAPQQFKQLLMVGGTDKYFQIAPCFRDEDPRADRAYGEFYQLDMEMSFVEQEDILAIIEPLMKELASRFGQKENYGLNADGGFRRLTWHEARERYGSDKPDLRWEWPILPVTELVAGCGFKVFADMAEKARHCVHALRIEGGARLTRREIDELTALALAKGAKGLAYIVVREGGELQSPIVKFLGDELAQRLLERVGAVEGDIVFFGADTWPTVCDALGAVRNECGKRFGLKDPSKAAWVWVTDFPMYQESEIEPGKIDFAHNPFSMPNGGLEALSVEDLTTVTAAQFDLVINGYEASSGAIRNHRPEIMYKAFERVGYNKEEIDRRFGHMIKAFSYGAPPHGGCAPGVDRILMALCELDSIRDIYAFPKDGQGRDVMLECPAPIDEKQLRELHIKPRQEIIQKESGQA